ncbi:MAG: hypothetical protein KDD42_03775 [Bdellovibrionales bacterium]|nr:hypothetical protein [Bdellovibrionales bacterium]
MFYSETNDWRSIIGPLSILIICTGIFTWYAPAWALLTGGCALLFFVIWVTIRDTTYQDLTRYSSKLKKPKRSQPDHFRSPPGSEMAEVRTIQELQHEKDSSMRWLSWLPFVWIATTLPFFMIIYLLFG